jgi:hypothetical protein
MEPRAALARARQAVGFRFRRAKAMAAGASTISPTITQKNGRSICVMSSIIYVCPRL